MIQPERIYLATPYTHPDPAIRRARFEAVTLAAGALIQRGFIVFSPITMGHPISETCADIPGDFAYWETACLSYLSDWATALMVLTLDGWEESRGVVREIAVAREWGLPVQYLSPASLTGRLGGATWISANFAAHLV